MFVSAIEPGSIKIGRKPFLDFANAKVYYLGYGRNAWNSTWINRYDRGRISFVDAELKRAAEERRVQGSVFKIEPLPLFVMRTARGTFGICEINTRSAHEYSELLKKIERDSPSKFFRHLPPLRQDWLLLLKLNWRSLPKDDYRGFSMRSASVGGQYLLRWVHVTPEPKPLFLDFCERLRVVLQDRGKRFDSATCAVSQSGTAF